MLKMLKHPNIVQLLAAYTFKGKHCLIFPKADSQTLGDLLDHPPPPQFKFLEQMIAALSGLCSAVHAVHNFYCSDLELLAIGCHHDLKPDNVLVHNGAFLLADFGLSTFKDSTKASSTFFKEVRGDYVAPECVDYDNLSKRNVVGRSSDIWSLGCIMLETLTYVMTGPRGVKTFEKDREFKIGDYKRYRFHHGSHLEAPAVTAQFDRLREGLGSRAGRKLLMLIQEILKLDVKRRPTAFEVNAKMQYITVESVCENIRRQYIRVFQKSKSMQAWVVLQKFTSWMQICKLDEHDLLEQWHSDHHSNYHLTRKCLLEMQECLTAMLPDCDHYSSHTYQSLNHINDVLHAALPSDLQRQAQAIFRSHALDTVDTSHLENMAKDASLRIDQAQLSVLAKVKLLNNMIQNESIMTYSEFKIDLSRLDKKGMTGKDTELAGGRIHGELRTIANGSIRVLIESKLYAHGVSEENLAELVNRLSRITKLLREAGPDFRLLSCSGFYLWPCV